MRTRALPALLALVAVVAAACSSPGSDDSGGGGGGAATEVPTKDVVSAVQTDAVLHASLPATVRTSGAITLGTTIAPGTNGLPHAGSIDGKQVGLDVDVRNAVAKVLGVKFTVQNGTFPTIIPGVQNGRYDVGQDNFGVTAERQKIVDFSTYLNDGQSFLGSRTAKVTKVDDLTDLCGSTIATSPGSTFQQILEQGKSRCAAAGKKAYTVQYFADNAPIFLGLANGKIDIYFGPTLSLRYDEKHIDGTKFLGEFSSTPVGFVTKKGSPLAAPLAAAVNKLIASGAYAKIFAKWGVGGIGIAKSQVNPKATL
jgi:polar amino acid transport system substrate-binding protein